MPTTFNDRQLNMLRSIIVGCFQQPWEENDPVAQIELYIKQLHEWVESKAPNAKQITLSNFPAKAVHPQLKITDTSNPNIDLNSLKNLPEVGSHCCAKSDLVDATGNSAVFPIFKFLMHKIDGKTILSLLQNQDSDLLALLNPDIKKSQHFAKLLLQASLPACQLSSHSLAKQIYFAIADNHRDNQSYHLISPQFSSILAHTIYQKVQEDRFGETAKMAREAKKKNNYSPHSFSLYPNLAIEKKGGTKPQNVSLLNNARAGTNYLLASLPPTTQLHRSSQAVYHKNSILQNFGKIKEVYHTLSKLKKWLESNPNAVYQTRDKRDAFLEALLCEFISFSIEIQDNLPAGWTQDKKCQLKEYEQLWFDPYRGEQDEDFAKVWLAGDWVETLCRQFGKWLNAQLEGKWMFGDTEYHYWVKSLKTCPSFLAQYKQLQNHLVKYPREEKLS